jgi:hypothetical protein
VNPASPSLLDDYRAVFSGPAGERVLADIIGFGAVFGDQLADRPDLWSYQAGLRALALHVLAQIGRGEPTRPVLHLLQTVATPVARPLPAPASSPEEYL